MEMDRRPEMVDVAERLRALRKAQIQRKQAQTIFPWGWRNKPAAQNNGETSTASNSHALQPLLSYLCRQFSLTEMKYATRNFDELALVGVGRSGKVYFGVIDGGRNRGIQMAIKCGRVVEDVYKFHAEIARMGKLRHHHLVSLVGYCRENEETMMLYDYMARGSLRERLYGNNTKEPPLTWMQRLDVCIGAARALHYLYECSVIYWDLTTTDILLDEKLVAKVSLPRVLSPQQNTMSADIMGTCCYLDREFIPTMQLTEKSDVYSFGVILFEVLCRRDVLDPTLPRNQVDLIE